MTVQSPGADVQVPAGLKQLPGDNAGLPVVGLGLRYIKDPMALWRDRHAKFGDVSWGRAFGQTAVTVLGPDACGEVLTNKDKAFSNGLGWTPLIGPFFDRGLMLLDGQEHLDHRRLMQEAFTRERLEGYALSLDEAVAPAVRAWPEENGFRFYPATKKLTLDLALSTFMGGAEGSTQAERDRMNAAFIDCVQAATSLVRADIGVGRWHRGIVGRRNLEEFLRRYLRTRRTVPGKDLFSVLCQVRGEDGSRFSDDDVVNHMIFLLMAAHDTSTLTTSTMVRYLGQHPEWQQRCRDESQAIEGVPGVAGLDALTSLDLVMKESLRLLAPVPAMARQAVKDTSIQGFFIPAGTNVGLSPHYSHHLAEFWPEPERFDPERFSAGRREDKVHRFAWEPFGGGVHKCLGMIFAGLEVKTILHHLLLNHSWSVDPAYETPINWTSLPMPKDGQPIDLRPL